jgi:hypothetical protein
VPYTYSGDPMDSDKDEVRFLLQDTDPGTLPLLTDEEIEFLLERWLPKYDSVTYVAAVAADTISRKFVGIVNISVDGVSVNTADLTQRYRDLAIQLRNEYVAGQIGAEVPLDNIMVGGQVDYSIAPLNFSIGLHDNPLAGQQDYGGQLGTPWVEWPG